MAEAGWPLIPREVLPAPVPPAARGRRPTRPAQPGTGRQLTIFGAETTEPSPLDLTGLLAGPGRLDRMGGTARVAVTVGSAWRVHVLVAELVGRGLVVHWRPVQTEDELRRVPSPPEPGADPPAGGDDVTDFGDFAVDLDDSGVIGAGKPARHDDGQTGGPGDGAPGGRRLAGRLGDPLVTAGAMGDGTEQHEPYPDEADGIGADAAGAGEAGPRGAGLHATRPQGEPGAPGVTALETGPEADADPERPVAPRVQFEVRTAYSGRLNGLARAWPGAAEQLFLSGPRLRLWVAAAGRPVEGGYALGLGDHDRRTWPAVDAALRRSGLDGALSDHGLDYLIMGRKRLARLAELVGECPEAAPADIWPSGAGA